MTVAMIGGILLCFGAYFTMQGYIYKAVSTYLLADLCWIAMAVQSGDSMGIVMTVIGTIMGTIALGKMYFGIMRKDIIKDGN